MSVENMPNYDAVVAIITLELRKLGGEGVSSSAKAS